MSLLPVKTGRRSRQRDEGHSPTPPLRLSGPYPQNVGGVQALITSQGTGPTQRNRWGRRLSK
ncbi:hypothetical protein BHMPCIPO_03459 [Ensifer sesbaniae]|nr:hypothetical protein [Ensifer sesbaniae]